MTKQSIEVPDGYILVSRAWYEEALLLMIGKAGCPHCGSTRAPTEQEASEMFRSRLGCRDCNRWWDPVRTWDDP